MARSHKKQVLYTVYTLLAVTCVVLLVQSGRLVFSPPRQTADSKGLVVHVNGHVTRPGIYRVTPGTTRFEILKTAGVLPTSDLTGAILSAQVENDETIEIGTLDEPVSLKTKSMNMRLEFYFGEMTIISSQGRNRLLQEGLDLDIGDRILTEANSQAEFSLNTYSRVDMDDFSELTVEKLGEEVGEKRVAELFQKSGICWYKTAYASKSELYRIVTPSSVITVGGTGADFMVEVKFNEILVHNIDGLLLVEKTSGEEAINLISGQTATIFSDDRPIQVHGLAPEANPNEKFSQLMKEKTNYLVRHMPLNLLFCGEPNVYFFISVQFESGITHVVSVPPTLSVSQFAFGVATFDQAHLQGGPVFASTLLENILDTRIPKFCIVNKAQAIRIAASLGPLNVKVDEKAATTLQVNAGQSRLSGGQLIAFLRPSISGFEDSRDRQLRVIKALFQSFSTKTVVITAILSQQILSGVETNLSTSDVMGQYAKFTARKNWNFRQHTLPTIAVKRDNAVVYEPDLTKCRTLLFGEQ